MLLISDILSIKCSIFILGRWGIFMSWILIGIFHKATISIEIRVGINIYTDIFVPSIINNIDINILGQFHIWKSIFVCLEVGVRLMGVVVVDWLRHSRLLVFFNFIVVHIDIWVQVVLPWIYLLLAVPVLPIRFIHVVFFFNFVLLSYSVRFDNIWILFQLSVGLWVAFRISVRLVRMGIGVGLSGCGHMHIHMSVNIYLLGISCI